MMSPFDDKIDCCGCTACYSACPKSAISMEEDSCGFRYPTINQTICIDCGICRKVCAFNRPNLLNEGRGPIKTYAVKNKDEKKRQESRSGGVFPEIASEVIRSGGVVYGVALDDDFVVRHHRASNDDEWKRFRKSKYVQSEMGETLKDIAKDLERSLPVLFSGTPCQCKAVNDFLDIKRVSKEKLILMDLVCHGVPSPGMFRNYIKWVEQKAKKNITDYEFRAKDTRIKWSEGVEKVTFGSRSAYQDFFIGDLFFFGENVRPSCHKCPFSSTERVGDITIGDCWGISNIKPEFADEKGISLVMVNSEKGSVAFDKVVERFRAIEISLDSVIQPALREPVPFTERYFDLWKDYSEMGFDSFAKKYMRNTYAFSRRCRKKVAHLLKMPFRMIRRMMHKK